MDKARELEVLERKHRIVQLSIEGKSIPFIADQEGIATVTVRRYLDDAMVDVRSALVEGGNQLLAKSHLRSELLLDKLMEKIINADDVSTVLPEIDRVTRLIDTQRKLIQGSNPIRVQHSGDSENPINVVHSGSEEYNYALEMARNDPSILIIEQTASTAELLIKEAQYDDYT